MIRRNFLAGMAGILAAGAAPAVLAQGSAMRIWVPKRQILYRYWTPSPRGGLTFRDSYEPVPPREFYKCDQDGMPMLWPGMGVVIDNGCLMAVAKPATIGATRALQFTDHIFLGRDHMPSLAG